MREKLLTILYKLFPFDLRGDGTVPPPQDGIKISCVINFYGRLDLLAGILYSLVGQTMPKESFEVVLVEDKGGTPAGKAMAEDFSAVLPIVYAPLDTNYGLMGYSRNFGLSRSRGEYILFLDDDTVILQKNALDILLKAFEANKIAEALIPHGFASYELLHGKYGFHDPYFMTSRCTAYRRSALAELSGFVSSFIGQEDVEFVIRFMLSGKTAVRVAELEYYHPPLLVPNFRKPMAVGYSFYALKSRYPLILWLLVLINCARHAPLYLLPERRFREQGRFGVGFILGVVDGIWGRKGQVYG